MKSKIALVGFSESSRHLAPYDDPEWEIWGCNHVFAQPGVKRVDVGFEIHELEELAIKYAAIEEVGWPGYLEQLAKLPKVYMREAYPEVPNSEKFPIEAIKRNFFFLEEFGPPTLDITEHEDQEPVKLIPLLRDVRPRSVFKSTLSEMCALALLRHEDPRDGGIGHHLEAIGVWGADMIMDFEYGFQRHNLSFLLGWARGLGIDVVIPDECALFKEADGIEVYGYDHAISKYAKLIDAYKKHINTLEEEHARMEHQSHTLATEQDNIRGAIRELTAYIEREDMDTIPKPELIARRKDLEEELVRLERENEGLIRLLFRTAGRADDAREWLERVGYNSRGEQLG